MLTKNLINISALLVAASSLTGFVIARATDDKPDSKVYAFVQSALLGSITLSMLAGTVETVRNGTRQDVFFMALITTQLFIASLLTATKPDAAYIPMVGAVAAMPIYNLLRDNKQNHSILPTYDA